MKGGREGRRDEGREGGIEGEQSRLGSEMMEICTEKRNWRPTRSEKLRRARADAADTDLSLIHISDGNLKDALRPREFLPGNAFAFAFAFAFAAAAAAATCCDLERSSHEAEVTRVHGVE